MFRTIFCLILVLPALCLTSPLFADSPELPLPAGSQALCLQNVRLRTGPSVSEAAVKTLSRGQILTALVTRDNRTNDTPYTHWCRVETDDGDTGWVSLDFVSLNRPGPLNSRTRRPVLTLSESGWLDPASDYAALGLSGANKINGRIYRLRSHWLPGGGQWLGPDVPAFVPRLLPAGLELNILDVHDDGWLAFYRSPPGTGEYDSYAARFYARDETMRWSVDLDRFLPADQPREIQDIRFVPPRLIFNAACASYSQETGGRCSELIAIRPDSAEELWRTPHLISNNIFIPAGEWLISGYGFTSEPDFLYIVDQVSGQVLAWQALDSAADYLEMDEDALWVTTTSRVYRYRISPSPAEK